MAAAMRAHPWAETSVGPVDGWPQSLRTAIRIVLTSRYAMWMCWGPDLTFFCNDAYRPTLGVKQPWALGASARKVWAEIWPDIGPRIDHVFTTGEATWDEGLRLFLVRSGYLEETFHTFSYSPLHDDDGIIAGMLCVVTEETERQIGERRLATLRELAGGLAEAHTEADVFAAVERSLARDPRDVPFSLTYLVNEDGACCARRTRTGVRVDHALAPDSVGPRDTTPWPLFDALAGHVRQVDLGIVGEEAWEGASPWPGRPTQAIVLPLAQAGQARPVGVFVAGLNPTRPFDQAYRSFLELLVGQIAAAVASARAYEAERRRAEALAEIDRAKTTFFSNVSHEFRTPLTLMLGPVEDLIRDAESGSAQHERLTLLQRNSLRLLKLVNALLDFSRIEAGRVQAQYQPIDLPRLTLDIASAFRSAMEKAELTYVIDCRPFSRLALVDAEMWEKVVLNLVANAFKFTLAGQVLVRLEERDGRAVLTVADTGVGIPAADVERVFERFRRIEGSRGRSHEGTGIGLALVQELVRLHGGTVSVVSEEGRGSTFTVEVPLGDPQLLGRSVDAASSLTGDGRASGYVEEAMRWLPGDDERTSFSSLPVMTETSRAADVTGAERPRVLVADDNADMRAYIGRLLAPDYDVILAPDGEAALDLAKQRRPALVVSDIMMPKLDGLGLMRELRADDGLRRVPIILVSARAGDEATVDAIEAGADDYLVKPFSARELRVRVRAQVERAAFASALEVTQHLLDEALREARIALWEWDPVADHIGMSRNLADVFGLREGQTLQSSADVLPLIHPDDRDGHIGLVSDAATRRGAYVSQFRITRPVDGAAAWLEDRGTSVVNRDDGTVSVTGMVADVTARKRTADRLAELLDSERAARAEAERNARLKDEFLATLSHELRTPLNAILGWTQLLGLEAAAGRSLDDGLAVIARNARAQAQIVDDLLDMSRIISGKLRLERRPVALAEVVRAAIETVQPTADARGVRLEAPASSSPTMVMGDASRLQQVIWNLLVNAIKFTPRDGLVRVEVTEHDLHAELKVVDTGEGIRADFLPHVFERFRQADASSTRRVGGLGLGLSIVRNLVELHGGSIRAESAGQDQGATFIVRLPLVSSDDPRSLEVGSSTLDEPATASIERPPAALHGVPVLVIDDDADARELIARVLSDAGVRVTSVASASEGLARLSTERMALVVCDIGMPGMDGYEFVSALRALPPDRGGATAAVALTAFARPEDRRRALQAGFDMHVSKPLEAHELLSVCAALTARTEIR